MTSKGSSNKTPYGMNSKSVSSYPLSRVTASVTGRGDKDGFQKMNGNSKYGVEVDVESLGEGSEVELNQRAIGMAHGGNGVIEGNSKGQSDLWNGEGIQVKTDVELRIENVRREIEKETVRVQSRQPK
jgi:hypothetical protein